VNILPSSEHKFPDSIAIRLHECFGHYDKLKLESAKTPPYDDFTEEENAWINQQIHDKLDILKSEMLGYVDEYCKDIKADGRNEVTLIRLRAILPPLNTISARRIKLVDARNKAIGVY